MPDLKVDLLGEIKVPPIILVHYETTLMQGDLKVNIHTLKSLKFNQSFTTVRLNPTPFFI
jgi:hypothetical protein